MNNCKNTLYIIATVGIYLLLAVVFFLQRGGAYIAPIRDFVAVPTLFAAIATAVKFRNGGKKSLAELDDLLHDNGLDWAEWKYWPEWK